MLHEGRTFVDRTDVTRACHELAIDPAITHWGHLWEDNDAEVPEQRREMERRAVLALAAFGQHRSSDSGSTAASLSAMARGDVDVPQISQLIETAITELTQRGVLQRVSVGSDERFAVVVRLFKLWLNEYGRTMLVPIYKSLEPPPLQSAVAAEVVTPTTAVFANEFLIDDDDLAAVADGLVYRLKPVDAMAVKNWLKQFHDDTSIQLMFRLLSQLRNRWFIDDARLAFALSRAYDSALKVAASAGVDAKFIRTGGVAPEFAMKQQYLRRDEAVGRVGNIYATYFGSETKSGAQIARRLKQAKRLVSVGELKTALDWLANPGGPVEPKQRFVLIVDDFVGSGYQFAGDVLPKLRAAQRNPKVAEAIASGRLAYFPLWAFRTGLDTIAAAMPELRVEPVHVLDECDEAFSEQSQVFETDSERTMAKRIATHIGKQLYSDHPLGWSDLQGLVVFAESVPNATLPILWASGIVDERPWRALFPR